MLFFIYFFGRLMLRARLTEVRETFTRGVWQAELTFIRFFQISQKIILDIRKTICDI